MPRVKLAHWHGGLAPGAELDVDDAELVALRRDGRVAEILPDGGGAVAQEAAAVEDAAPEPAELPAPEPEPEPEDGSLAKGRRRR